MRVGDPYSRFLIFETWRAIAVSRGDSKAAEDCMARMAVVWHYDLTALEKACLASRTPQKSGIMAAA
jgi:hypothetical protein